MMASYPFAYGNIPLPPIHADDYEFGATSFLHPLYSHTLPPTDVLEDDTSFVVFIEVPGVSKDSIIIGVHGNHLIVNGTAPVSTLTSAKEDKFRSRQRRHGNFVKTIKINSGVDESELKATLAEGVLKIVVPKVGKNAGKKEKENKVPIREESLARVETSIGGQ
ncbi:hypothetical protein MNV49_000693 [Pseudohyphozyma bogoriensis]|nr:hypothetical protein MNV49_000693 [Pseudohyphozyma bogoriensis]